MCDVNLYTIFSISHCRIDVIRKIEGLVRFVLGIIYGVLRDEYPYCLCCPLLKAFIKLF